MSYNLLDILVTAQLYTPENYKKIIQHKSFWYLHDGLIELMKKKLLSKENFIALTEHEAPLFLAKAMILFDTEHLPQDKLHQHLIKAKNPYIAAKIYHSLHTMNPDYELNSSLESLSESSIHQALELLKKENIIEPEYLDPIFTHKTPYELALSFKLLKSCHLLKPYPLKLLSQHPLPYSLAYIIKILDFSKLYNDINLSIVVNHFKLHDLESIFKHWTLVTKTLSQNDFILITSSTKYLDEMSRILSRLDEYDLLNNSSLKLIKNFITLLPTLDQYIESLINANMMNSLNLYALENHAQPNLLKDAIQHLSDLRILRQRNFNFISRSLLENPDIFAYAYTYLLHLKYGSNLAFYILEHSDLKKISKYAIDYFLETNELSNEANKSRLISQQNSFDTIKILKQLDKAKLLTQERLDEVFSHTHPLKFTKALMSLHQNSILTPRNKACLEKISPKIVHICAEIFVILKQAELQTEENFKLIMNLMLTESKDSIKNFEEALTILYQHGLLDQRKLELTLFHPEFWNLAWTMLLLENDALLNEESFFQIVAIEDLKDFNCALQCLKQNRILNKSTFTALVEHPVLYNSNDDSNDMAFDFWNNWGKNLSLKNFQKFMTAAESKEPLRAIFKLQKEIISLSLQNDFLGDTTMLARNISMSVLKLKQLYDKDFHPREEINKLKFMVDQLTDNPKQILAKDCLLYLLNPYVYFSDLKPSMTELEFFGLVSHAIQHSPKLTCTRLNALEKLVDVLYEIQEDQHLKDENDLLFRNLAVKKIMTMLKEIHPDIDTPEITPEFIAEQFPQIVKNFLLLYLSHNSNPLSAQDYREMKFLISKLQQCQNLEPIWDKLKNKLELLLWQEFGNVFEDNKEHPLFKVMMNTGPSLSLPDIDKIESSLKLSDGYHAYIAAEKAQFEISSFCVFLGQESERLESNRPQKRLCCNGVFE